MWSEHLRLRHAATAPAVDAARAVVARLVAVRAAVLAAAREVEHPLSRGCLFNPGLRRFTITTHSTTPNTILRGIACLLAGPGFMQRRIRWRSFNSRNSSGSS